MWAAWQRERVIRESPLPQFLKRKLRETYPHLSGKDADLVERGLRQFFMACSRSKRQFVAMPSKAVDAMWHEFILHTKAYENWCQLTLGYFLHHRPPKRSAKKPTAMMACGVRGTGPAAKRRSTRADRRACRCSSRSTANWALKVASATCPIAATSAASPTEMATGVVGRIAAAVFRTDLPAAMAAVLAAQSPRAMLAVTAAVEMGAAAAGVEGISLFGRSSAFDRKHVRLNLPVNRAAPKALRDGFLCHTGRLGQA